MGMSSRLCARPGCSEPATSTLTYDYRASHVWIDDLTRESDPNEYDLCERCADSRSVPRGWELRDRRSYAPRLLHAS
jgi:hypothetical protein